MIQHSLNIFADEYEKKYICVKIAENIIYLFGTYSSSDTKLLIKGKIPLKMWF